MDKILVPIDLKETTLNALSYACSLANKTGQEIIALHVVKSEKEISEAELVLKQVVSDLSLSKKVNTVVEAGKLNTTINKVADQHDVGLVVMGTYNAQGRHKLLGAKSINVLANGDIPYLMVQSGTKYSELGKIAFTIDTNKECIQVVRAAVEIAKRFDSELVLIAGDHTDRALKANVQINIRVALGVIKDHGLNYSIEYLGRKDFIKNMMAFCKDSNISMFAATFYNDTVNIFAEKFVQTLLENEMKIPVLTMNSVAVGKSSQFAIVS